MNMTGQVLRSPDYLLDSLTRLSFSHNTQHVEFKFGK